MGSNKVGFLPNGYFNHLKNINTISFTARELDVISCLFNLRGGSKIASILDITTRTIETHITNIKKKIDNHSREGVIDFIEKSGNSHLIRKHYHNLLIQADFKKRLKQISTIIYNKTPTYWLFYFKEKRENPIISAIQIHLKLVGIKLFILDREEELLQNKGSDNIIYVVTDKLQNKCNFSKKLQQLTQKTNCIILFISDTTTNKTNNQLITLKSIIDLNQENYYLAFFEFLKRLLPTFDFTDNIVQMQSYHRSIITPAPNNAQTELLSDLAFNLKSSKLSSLSNKFPKKSRWLTAFTVIGLFGFSIAFYSSQTLTINASSVAQKQKNNNSIEWNLPRQDHIFIGRKQLLDALANKLHPKTSLPYPADELLVVSVFAGLGGIGKTQLALQYIHNDKHPYTLKAWFLAENIDQLKQQYIDFAKNIGYKAIDTTIDPAISYVKAWLLQNPGWLLVFDNVTNYETIKKFLPSKGGCILLTTRQRKWPNTFNTINVDLMDEEEAIALIQSLIQRKITAAEIEPQKELVKTLGYLPLALAHAGAYMRIRQ